MTDVHAAGMTIEVDGDSNRDAVVMIHGLGGSSNTFSTLMPSLGGYRVLRPDLIGAGRSATRPRAARLADLAKQLALATSLFGIKRAHFVAHSMGTWLCQWLAAERPDLVASMVLFGAITEPADVNRDGLRARAQTVRKGNMADVASQIASQSLASRSVATQPAIVAFVRESLMRQSAEGYSLHCEALADVTAIDPSRIQCPVTIVTGRDDPVTPPSMGQHLANNLRHGRLHIIESCGHWAPIEAPRACREVLDSHLIRHALAGG